MSKLVQMAFAVGASLLIGFAVASLTRDVGDNREAPAASTQAPLAFDSAAPVEARLSALEQSLGIERQARQLLQEEVMILTAEIERMSGGEGLDLPAPDATVEAEASVADARQSRRRNDSERRMDRMIAAGFTTSEAEWIMRRESELQMEALQARYDARRAGEPAGDFNRRSTANTLRQELGEEGYERYLTANGRPTRVAISSVLEGSPALAAGLRPGDQILSYDGRRVFSMNEITTLTMQGEAGQNVLVDITRDGIQMQVAIPRGPLGVTGGRRYRR